MPIGSALKQKFVQGLTVKFNTVSTVDIEPGSTTDSTALHEINSTGTLTANFATSGANGLDTGTEAADQLYAVHIISDSSLVNSPAALLSLSETAPTLPPGYDIFNVEGWIYNDAASNIQPFVILGDGRARTLVYDVEGADFSVITAGTATAFTALDCSQFVPTGSFKIVTLRYIFTNNAGDPLDRLRIRPTSFVTTSPTGTFRNGNLHPVPKISATAVMVNAASQFDYHVDSVVNNAATINIGGFTFGI